MKIAVCQLLVEGGEPHRNLKRAEALIEKARNNCDMVWLFCLKL